MTQEVVTKSTGAIHYPAIFRQAIVLLWQEKMVWIVIALIYLFQRVIGYILPKQNLSKFELSATNVLFDLIFQILWMIGNAFLIQVFYYLVENQPYQLKDLWANATHSFFRMLLSFFLVVFGCIPFLFILLAGAIGIYYLRAPQISTEFLALLMVVFIFVLYGYTIFVQIELVVQQKSIGKGIVHGLKLVFQNFGPVTVFVILLTLFTWTVINLGTIFTLFLHQIPVGFDSNTLQQIQIINQTPVIQIWMTIHGIVTELFTYSASIAFYNVLRKNTKGKDQ